MNLSASEIRIKLAETAEERDQIFRFRYQIYVEEMGRAQKHADHVNRRIEDPLDAGGLILGAWNRNEVIGTVRTNFVGFCEIGEYLDMYSLVHLDPDRLRKSSVTTRLMIRPDFRKGTLAIRLARAVYELGLKAGIISDYIDCNHHLLGFFEGLGYRLHRDNLVHPEYGLVNVLSLELSDHDHFLLVGSPFLRSLEQWRWGKELEAVL